ncbi:MAG: TraB/GumN family protein [Candidatus Methanofastidiosia archaeon]
MVIKRLAIGENDLIIIGTAHVSKESRKEVKKTIEEEKPDIVGVELDKGRFETITQGEKWKEKDVYKIIHEGKSHMFLASLLLSNFQKKLGEELGSAPGAEMLEAIEAAGDSQIILLDRDINTTFKRAWAKMSLKEKFKILYSAFFSFLEDEDIDEEMIKKLKQEDILTTMLEELSREMSTIKEVLIDERDAYIAKRIGNTLKKEKNKKMVAVVGAGHVGGIVSNLNKNIDLTKLDEIPKKISILKMVAWLVPVVFLSLIAWGFYSSGAQLTLEMIKKWFLINGTLSLAGVLLAFGHPISAAVAFLAAPFTSLNPTIAAGWFAGASEAYLRKPKVKDFENLNEIDSVWGLWKNKITRILLVVAFANVGSTVGTFIALPYLASLI